MEEENIDKKEENISKEEYLKLKRSNEKKKATIVILLFAMILIVAVAVLFYLALCKGGNSGANIQQEANNTTKKVISYEEFKNSLKDYNPVIETSENESKKLSWSNIAYSVALSDDGKVSINKNGEEPIVISNITEAVNIENINGITHHVYILLSNGDVYEYYVSDLENEQMKTATKIDGISGGTKFVRTFYDPCKGQGCGGALLIGVLDSNNQYIELESYQA